MTIGEWPKKKNIWSLNLTRKVNIFLGFDVENDFICQHFDVKIKCFHVNDLKNNIILLFRIMAEVIKHWKYPDKQKKTKTEGIKLKHFSGFDIYFWHRFGLANAINDYLGLKICVVCIGNF